MLPEDAARRHEVVAGRFAELTRGVLQGEWDAPAPVEGWTARDVVGHLVGWFPGFLESGTGLVLRSGPDVAVDPVGAWREHAAQVQALLDDPATADRRFSNPHTGAHPLAVAVDMFYTADVFMHSWDLAVATGQPIELDAEFAERLLAGMRPIEQVMRSSAQYGPEVEVPEGSDAPTRLLGFIGRDPFWAPPPR
ncbi:TIGR03086 family metal-binding protein [Herbiconiux liangxiaofengii]|uniref:TIGR03086 family metal-binding protein n=1 Tax=Herbiconiux liangxiaofengii TaxID=3342795 RepID=UPI0035BB08C1